MPRDKIATSRGPLPYQKRKEKPRTKRLFNHGDDDPADIWVFPDDLSDVPVSRPAPVAPASKAKQKKDDTMTERVRKNVEREEELKAKAILIANSVLLPPITSESQMREVYDRVLLWNTILTENPIRESFLKTDRPVAMQVINPRTNTREFIRIRGITDEIKLKFCPEGVSHYVKPTKNSGSIRGMLKITESDLDELFASDYESEVEKTTISEDVFLREMADLMEVEEDEIPDKPDASVASSAQPKDSYAMRIEKAKSRGRLTHLKMEIYTDTYIELLRRKKNLAEKLEKVFLKQLRRKGLDEKLSPDVVRIISILNIEELQLVIIAAEVPVCAYRHLDRYLKTIERIRQTNADAKKAKAAAGVRSRIAQQFSRVSQKAAAPPITKPVLFGTSADAIVYCPRRDGLAVVEYTTTTGDWNAGRGQMLPPFQKFENSTKNRKRIQLALTMEHTRQTYGPILIDNDISTELYGYIIFTSPEGDRYELYVMPPHEQEAIVSLIAEYRVENERGQYVLAYPELV
jgi:hypothetical protein